MLRKVLIFTGAICTLNCYAVNVHWGNITNTTCESGDDITVPTEEPTPQIGYHFIGWRMGLRQLEYLESTGTQWIDSGLVPNNRTGFYIDFLTTNDLCNCSNYGALFGVHYGIYTIATWGSAGYFDYGGSQLPTYIEKNKRGSISFINRVFIDFTGKQTILAARNINTNRHIYLFAEHNSNSDSANGKMKGKLYGLSFYDNSTPIRDFIPVIDENNVPCLYDKVEDKLYHNSGTGDFIAGSVVGSGGLSATRYTSGNTISNGCHGDLDDIYFYPVFEPNILTLNWDYKDETGRTEQTQCVYDTPITDVPEEPVRPGYKFMGWRVKVPE